MEVVFDDPDLDRLELDRSFTKGLSAEIVRSFRSRMQVIRAAPDERDFRALKSWRFEKLKGKRNGQFSIRLNDQYRLIVEIESDSVGKRVRIVGIEDYH